MLMKKTVLTSAALLLSTSLISAAAFAQASERDLEAEEANRELVVEFYERFFNDHETVEAGEVIAEDYIQHNPEVPDGKEPFVSYFTGFFEENPDSRAEIKRSAADGDLVWLHVHSTNGDDDQGEAVHLPRGR